MSFEVNGSVKKPRFVGTMTLMAGTAVFISATMIIYFNALFSGDGLQSFGTGLGLAATALMPYLLSALVAAVTAIGIVTILPLVRSAYASQAISGRLRELACGDLASPVLAEGTSQLEDIVAELDGAIAGLSSQIVQLKVVNRQQWNTLCEIRASVEGGDCSGALRAVEKMEKGWEKLAAIESRLWT